MGVRSLLAVLILSVVLTVASFSPVFGAASPSATQQLEAEVEPTIAIGAFWANGANNSTIYLLDLLADNQEYSWDGGASGEQVKHSSNVAIDLYVRAAGDLTNGSNTIPLSNLKYADYGASVAKTAFTTSYVRVRENWPAPSQGNELTIPVDLYLLVPFATPPGNYTTTVYHAAVQTGGTAPTSP
jgi:hypothetical protein